MELAQVINDVRPLFRQGLDKSQIFYKLLKKYPKLSYSVLSQAYDSVFYERR